MQLFVNLGRGGDACRIGFQVSSLYIIHLNARPKTPQKASDEELRHLDFENKSIKIPNNDSSFGETTFLFSFLASSCGMKDTCSWWHSSLFRFFVKFINFSSSACCISVQWLYRNLDKFLWFFGHISGSSLILYDALYVLAIFGEYKISKKLKWPCLSVGSIIVISVVSLSVKLTLKCWKIF